jgi:hypothetical protein
MRALSSILCTGLLLLVAGVGLAQDAALPAPPRSEAEKNALLDRIIANQKKSDEAMNVYERIERVETRKNSSDPAPSETRYFRVFPAGTGIDHIPVGPDGKPRDHAAYRAELEKLAHALAWASEDGPDQREAYEKVAKKLRERNELIDATRTAFLYTFVGDDARNGRALFKYRMQPNPAYKPTSRATTIFTKVNGFVWIDPASSQLARVEGEITGDISIGIFLGKIYKGSRFMQERYEAAPGLWLPSFSQFDFDGRKFIIPFSIHQRTFYSQYRRVGPPEKALALIRAELDGPVRTPADP